MTDLTCSVCGEPAYFHETTVGSERTSEHWMPCGHSRSPAPHPRTPEPSERPGGEGAQ